MAAEPIEVVHDPLPPGADVRSHGFSLKLRDPAAARLYFDELQRQRTPPHQRPRQLSKKPPAHSGGRNPRSMPRPKTPPLVTFEDVEREFAVGLARADISRKDASSWPPIILQTRISRTNDDGTTAPQRQVANMAGHWCVKHHRRPVRLVHEEVSGSIFRRHRRHIFDQFYDDLANDRILDGVTGRPVKAIGCFLLDRFTRDPEEGGDWLRLLRSKGIDLHETYYDEDPKPLHLVEHDIREAWNRAWKEVERFRERIMDALETKALVGLPPLGVDNLYGHRRLRDAKGKTIGYKVVPAEAAIVRTCVDAVLAGRSRYSVLCWLNDNGHMTRTGRYWVYRQLDHMLRSPRLAGLVRLRTDRMRLHEPDYLGDLYPHELIYEDGQQPARGFDPPIEPIIPYPIWAQLQECLAAQTVKHGPHIQHLASGYVECSACGQPLKAGSASHGRHTYYRCPRYEQRGHSHSKGLGGVGHDGLRHPTVRIDHMDKVLEEVVFAAVDREPDPNQAPPQIDVEVERRRIEEEIAVLDARLGDISYMLGKATISRVEYDAWSNEVSSDRAARSGELRELLRRQPRELLPHGTTLRDLWPNMSIEQRRTWLGLVFKRVVLKPAQSYIVVGPRLEFTFRDGYEPPQEELASLLMAIDDEFLAGRYRRETSSEIADRIYALYEEGASLRETGRVLRREGIVGARGGKTWAGPMTRHVLQKACQDRGVEYQPTFDYGATPPETCELVGKLMSQLDTYAAVARELDRLGVERPNGKPWSSTSVLGVLRLRERKTGTPRPLSRRSGARRPGPKVHLPDVLRQEIWERHRIQGQTLGEIAAWLEGLGIHTARGKNHWDRSSILEIVRSVDRERDEPDSDDSEAS